MTKNAKNESFIEKNNKKFEYIESLLLAFLAYQYLTLWLAPDLNNPEKVFQFTSLMAFEFVMVHSEVFMATMPKKMSLLILLPFYGVFAFGFNYMVGGGIIASMYLLTVFNRMRFAFFNVSDDLKVQVIAKSIIAVFIYFFLTIIVVISSGFIPKFGLSSENLILMDYHSAKNGSGLFIDEPQTGIALGFFYYTLLAFFFFAVNNITKWPYFKKIKGLITDMRSMKNMHQMKDE